MVSADGGKSWEVRGQIPLAELAVSPSDASTLIATTQEGPARSTDSGRSFRLLTGAPQLLLVTGCGCSGGASPSTFDRRS